VTSVAVPDDLDRRILKALQDDARASLRTIAAAVDSTTPTVSSRVRRMEETGLIQGYTVLVRGTRPVRVSPQEWSCGQCAGPIRGSARTRRLGGRHYAFCCRGCENVFTQRFRRASADA
jgi:DNA-binding Lrp family transcriptional regulator